MSNVDHTFQLVDWNQMADDCEEQADRHPHAAKELSRVADELRGPCDGKTEFLRAIRKNPDEAWRQFRWRIEDRDPPQSATELLRWCANRANHYAA